MDEITKIKLHGEQPIAKISDTLLDKLIRRDFINNADLVKEKFTNIVSDNIEGKNRIAAAIIKLANKNINTLDHFIETANADPRDIIMLAEYPRNSKLGFDEFENESIKKVYIDDFVEYSDWLNATH